MVSKRCEDTLNVLMLQSLHNFGIILDDLDNILQPTSLMISFNNLKMKYLSSISQEALMALKSTGPPLVMTMKLNLP